MSVRANALPLDEVRSGDWYFGFDCVICDTRFAVLEDRSAGQKRLNLGGKGHIQARCPHCSVDGLYTVDQLYQYQAG
jgi:hypothetical protein